MKRLNLLFAILFVLTYSITSYSQVPKVFEEWTTEDGVQNMFLESFSIADANRNVYIGGATFNVSGNYDILLSKYDRSGVLLWSEYYAGAGNGDDAAVAICFGNNSEIYITGSVYTSSVNNNDCVLLKYDSSGNLDWARTYNGSASDMDFGTDLIVDQDDYIYVSGACGETNNYYDFMVLKYNDSGTLQWDNTWDDSNLLDIPNKINFSDGNVVLAGGAQINATKWEYAVVTFLQSTGAYQSESVSNTTGNGFDQILDLTVDASDNVYVTGAIEKLNTGYDIRTVKLDSSLTVQWFATYNGLDSLDDKGKAIAVDASGNVYVTGFVNTDDDGEDNVTIKYNSSGTQQWDYLYDGGENGDDCGESLVIDSQGDIISTGYTFNGSNFDYYTQKINSSGTLVWSIDYNGLLNKDDKAFDICLDDDGDIIVVGQSYGESSYKYLAVKYVEKDVIIPPDTEIVSISYLENRGQILNINQQQIPDVKYYSKSTTPALFFQDSKLSYILTDSNETTGMQDFHRIDMEFYKANSNVKVRAFEEKDTYTNYYLGHIPEGRARLKNYSKLLYKDLFNNIDLQYSSNKSGSKCYYIINSNANPADIKIDYLGADSLYIDTSDSSLVITTSLEDIVFPKAKAYQIDANGIKINLPWNPEFSLSSNRLSFITSTYNTNLPLVIEVSYNIVSTQTTSNENLEWSSFFGGGNYDDILDVETANYTIFHPDNVYAIGGSQSVYYTMNIGAYSASNIFLRDVIVKVLDGISHTMFDTFYGDKRYDYGTCITVDHSGNIYIAGCTNSEFVPVVDNTANSNAYQFSNPDPSFFDFDIIIAKFSRDGDLVWSTYYGEASSYEYPFDIVWELNPNSLTEENLFVVGQGTSLTPLEDLGNGAYYNSTAGTGLIIRFNEDLDREWATLYPVQIITAITVSTWSFLPNIFIAGIADANILPVTNADPNFNSTSFYNSNLDGFISAFDYNGVITMAQYIGGEDLDYVSDIQMIDEFGGLENKIVIVGTTKSFNFLHKDNDSSTSLDFYNPITYYSSSIQVREDVFITKISIPVTSGTPYLIEWSTYYGTENTDIATSVSIDSDDNIYVVGYTDGGTINGTSTIPFPTTNPLNAFIENDLLELVPDPPLYPQYDVLIAAFSPDCKLFWTTYFGGYKYDEAQACAITESNKLYIGGKTNGYYNMLTPPIHYFDEPDANYLPLGNTPNFIYNSTPSPDGFISRFNLSNFITLNNPVVEKPRSTIQVIPNPANKLINIKVDKTYSNCTIIIINSNGQIVYNKYYSLLTHSEWIDISNLKAGIYFIKIYSDIDKTQLSAKFIKL